MRKVVVTGANGFLGNALCKELIRNGVQVFALVKCGGEPIEGALMVECEMSDYYRLDELVLSDFDTIFHFAWAGSAGEVRGDYNVQLKNIRYTCELIESCYKKKCKRFIFASSIMEYEVVENVNADLELGLNSIYSTSKLTADYYINALTSSKFKMDYIRGIISNVYGPGEKSLRLVNNSVRRMLRGERCSFSPGEQLYDFVYIDDAIKAFISIACYGKSHKAYYVGSLNPKPLKEFLIEMRDAINPNLDIGIGDISFDGVSLSYEEFDIMAVKEDTGFAARYSFREGIKKTAEWIQNNEM